MAKNNDWLGVMFIGLGFGAAGVAFSLAIMTTRMGPAAIPIWAIAAWGGMMIFRGPIGQALAARIGGQAPADSPELPQEVYGELDDLRARVAELEERVDFSERLLTKQSSEQQS
jgi:hypothetical protein